MPGKHFVRLGKSKLVRLPEKVQDWAQEMARILDTKEDPQELMRILKELAEQCK